MAQHWTYWDLFDLEYFLRSDAGLSPLALHQRDRQIFLESGPGAEGDRPRDLLHRWLLTRRYQEFPSGSRSPGSIIEEAGRLVSLLLPTLALLTGLLSGLAFFTYSGTTPVNVFHFLVLFVFSQLVLLLVVLVTLSLRLAGFRQLPSIIRPLYGSLVIALGNRLQRRLLQALSADRRSTYEQVFGLAGKAGRTYGRVLYWPLFALSQLMLLAFNVGLLASTLFRVITSDMAFGWQSTIQLSSELIHRGAQLLALPWSWLVPAHLAYPGLQEIEGSRIILKEGIYHLATGDLISWWPFLLLCILFYGILLRLLLLAAGRYLQARALRQLAFATADCQRVLQRLQTPLLSTQAAPAGPPAQSGKQRQPRPAATPENIPAGNAEIPLILLVPEDIAARYHSHIVRELHQQYRFSCSRQETIMRDYDSDRLLLQQLKHTSGRTAIFVVMEAWMPPIADFLSFVRELRAALGPESLIYVGLVGRLGGDETFLPPASGDSRIWRQKLDSLGDPFLTILELGLADNVPVSQP